MADYAVKCSCGQSTVVSEWALGASLKCRSCGRPLEATEKNTRAVEGTGRARPASAPPGSDLPPPPEARIFAKAESAPPAAAPVQRDAAAEPVSAPPETPSTTNCARCGRAFRGDWDRYHRAEGVICHVCANQYRDEPVAEAESAGPQELRNVPSREYTGVLDHPNLPDPGFAAARERSEFFRQAAIVAGILMIVISGVLLATGALDSEPLVSPVAQEGVAEDMPELPGWMPYALLAVRFLSNCATTLVALYLLLWWMRELPNDTLWANVLALSIVVAPLEALGVGLDFVRYIGPFLHVLVTAGVLYKVYGLDLVGLFLLAILGVLLRPLVTILEQFVVGFLALGAL